MTLVKKILTNISLEWFESNNISFHNRFGTRLRVGDEVRFLQDLSVEPYVGFHAGKNLFKIGYMSYSNSQLPLDVKVGRYCSIASGVSFISYNHPWRCLSTSVFTHDRKTDLTARTLRDFHFANENFKIVPNPQKDQVVVENDVWIGQNCALAAGVILGTGSIIAANSVVTKNVPPYAIVGGNPAKIIKFRFTDQICAALYESQWWDYNYTEFFGMNISEPSIFLNEFNEKKSILLKFVPDKVRIADCPF